DDALVLVPLRDRVELLARTLLDLHPAPLRLGGDLGERLARVELDVDGAHVARVRTDRLRDGAGTDDDALHAASPVTSAISRAMAWTAEHGSAASRIGRPITSRSAPARIASAGVATRAWSPRSFPCGRTPGTTSNAPSPATPRTTAHSAGEQTKPSMP